MLVTLGGGGARLAYGSPHLPTYARFRKTISTYLRCGPQKRVPGPHKTIFPKAMRCGCEQPLCVLLFYTKLCDATGCDRLQLLRKRAARLPYGSPRLALSWRARSLGRFREALLGLSLFLPSSSLSSLSSSPLFSFSGALSAAAPPICMRTPQTSTFD